MSTPGMRLLQFYKKKLHYSHILIVDFSPRFVISSAFSRLIAANITRNGMLKFTSYKLYIFSTSIF